MNLTIIRHIFAFAALVFAFGLACARADTNSGLDLTRPLGAVGVSYKNVYITPQDQFVLTKALSVSMSIAHGQLFVSTQFRGPNAVVFQYNYVLRASGRFRQTFGAVAAFQSAGALGAKEQQIGALYQLAYQRSNNMTLMLLAQYHVGFNASQEVGRYNVLTIDPSILFTFANQSYAALMPEYRGYTGQIRSSQYDTKIDVGRVFNGTYDVSMFYGLPMGRYSKGNVRRATYGFNVGIRL